LSAAFAELAPAIAAARAFSPEEAAILRAIAEETPGWAPAVINADGAVDAAIRTAEVLHANANPRLTGIAHQRLLAITSERASAMAPGGTLGELQFVRYAPGGGYIDHRDTPLTGGTTRVLSLVCYLNDDFSGGATTFAASALRIQPQSGLVIAFAPHLLHAAEPVIAGTKMVITAWYHAR
jgi:prolyl 4-hydroxylase